MKILLTNFGTYSKKQFEFQNNAFTLFKGDNGSGKSTIFKAICWVLYDKLKIVRHGEESCEVVLSDEKWIVKRTSKPKTLKLQLDGAIFEGSAAQELIIDKITKMNWEQFSLSTMINSNTRCSLASITPTERFNVIRDLVSSLSQPKIDAEKISEYEKTLKSMSDVTLGETNILRAQLEKFNNPVKVEFDEEIYETHIHNLKILLDKREKWVKILSTGIPKDEAIRKLEQLNNAEKVKEKLQMYKKHLQYARHQEQIKNLKETFEKDKVVYFETLKKEFENLVNYDEKMLKEVASEYEIRKNQKEENNPYWNWDVDKIQEIDVNIGTNKQKCPCCEEFLALQDKKIIVWNKKWDKTKDVAKILPLKKLKYNFDEKASEKWELAVKTRLRKSELSRILENQILSPELIRMKKSFGEKLSPPQGFKECDIQTLEERIEKLTSQLGSYPKESERHLLETIASTKKYPTKEKLESLTEEINNTSQICEEMRNQRDKFKQYQDYKKIKLELKKISQKEEQLRNDSIAIERLKVLQKEAEIMSMQNVIDTLNLYAEEYLAKFFDDTINVSLDVIRKTAKNVKMSLEMNIQYCGQPFNITEFSQGELIKINLAFILAMNKLQDSHYLFLDEVLQNLDKGVLIEIYSCLKLLNKSVFVIDHNSIEGFFDVVETFSKE